MTEEKNEQEAPSFVDDYFSLPLNSPETLKKLFSHLRAFLDTIASKNYQDPRLYLLEGMVDRLCKCARKHVKLEPYNLKAACEAANKFVNAGLLYHRRQNSSQHDLTLMLFPFATPAATRHRCARLHHNLYTRISEIYNKASTALDTNNDQLNLYDFYAPDTSNKQTAADLIQEAISLVDSDRSITQDARDRITSHLKTALAELQKNRPNWPRFFGKMKEAIIVAGAIGSIVGAGCAMYRVWQKLDQAVTAIEQTCININYIRLANNALTGGAPAPPLLGQPANDMEPDTEDAVGDLDAQEQVIAQ